MLKKKNKLHANYVVVFSMQNAHPYFEWNHLLVTGKFFSRNQEENKAGKC